MGKDLASSFPEAREVFQQADDILGTSLSHLCWEGPEEELTFTVNAQPAILVHSYAVWVVLSARRPLPVQLGAGHSLGEFTAHLAAGTLSFESTLRSVRRRGELMFESGRVRAGSMAAVLGLEDEAADHLCRDSSTPESLVVPANFNAPGQIVISGDEAAVLRAGEHAKAAGAKRFLPLKVSGAFHSPLMEVAEPGLRQQLDAVEFRDPYFGVVSNATAEVVTAATAARDLLIRQLTSPVRWTASMQVMLDSGVRRYVEIGPGTVLAGLLRRLDRSVEVRSLGSASELDQYLREEG